jgi:hypothetical protein
LNAKKNQKGGYNMFVHKKISNYGSDNYIISRLMSLNGFIEYYGPFCSDDEVIQNIINIIWDEQKLLMRCYEVRENLNEETEKVNNEIIEGDKYFGKTNEAPTIIDIEGKLADFLYKAKMTLREMVNLFKLFYSIDIQEPHYNRISDVILNKYGNDDEFGNYIKGNHDTWIKLIIEMRNAFEHPGEKNRILKVHDYTVNSNEKVVVPPRVEFKQNELNYSGDILSLMNVVLINILKFTEDVVLFLLDKNTTNPKYFIIHELDYESTDGERKERFGVAFVGKI